MAIAFLKHMPKFQFIRLIFRTFILLSIFGFEAIEGAAPVSEASMNDIFIATNPAMVLFYATLIHKNSGNAQEEFVLDPKGKLALRTQINGVSLYKVREQKDPSPLLNIRVPDSKASDFGAAVFHPKLSMAYVVAKVPSSFGAGSVPQILSVEVGEKFNKQMEIDEPYAAILETENIYTAGNTTSLAVDPSGTKLYALSKKGDYEVFQISDKGTLRLIKNYTLTFGSGLKDRRLIFQNKIPKTGEATRGILIEDDGRSTVLRAITMREEGRLADSSERLILKEAPKQILLSQDGNTIKILTENEAKLADVNAISGKINLRASAVAEGNTTDSLQ